MPKPPVSWCEALEAEYRAVCGAAPFDGAAPEDAGERLRALHARIHERKPTALCLSGGGIRSATFALGVLQGLAYNGVLGTIDYLSTVSGGGYTGGWFTTWLHRAGAAGRESVLETLNPGRNLHQAACGDAVDDSSPVERVRRTCRYLAPRGGVVSADVWTLVTTMGRNLILNWLVIIPLFAAALMVPRIYEAALRGVESGFVTGIGCHSGAAGFWSFVAGIAGFVVATGYVVLNFVGLGGRWSQGRFLSWFLVPAVVGAVGITFFWAAYPCEPNLRVSVILASVIPAAGWIVLGLIASRIAKDQTHGGTLRIKVGLQTVVAALAAGPIIGAGTWWIGSFQYGFGAGVPMRELYAVFAVPLVLALALVQITAFVGLASSELDDAALEWWSRCGAWLGIAAVLWVAAGLLVFYMADVVEYGVRAAGNALDKGGRGHAAVSALVASLVPLLSSLAGLATRAGGSTRPSVVRRVVQAVALPAVIFALLSTIAWIDLRVAGHDAGIGRTVALCAGFTAFGLAMSWFVPVNRFSLHGMYRQRLIRTFLGASRRDRQPNGFTGFDAHDDVCVHELADVRPLHVINATLNAVSSTHVGRHEHQSESFTFTPLHVGNPDIGYRPASEYGSDGGGTGTGLSLGTALAVSGAAASPEMGMYTTKSRAFLLTLANARLGLWFGNPKSETTWRSSEPRFGVGPLMRELLGLTTDHNPYVYLSDGGHYENLGLWAMVARRCHFIIVSDAGCDPTYSFDDLANAVRRIRLDLGIPILFPALDLTKAGQGTTNTHAAIGTIRYAVVDGPDAPDGVILYLKATLSGDEPIDVRNFSVTDPLFPHDSTGNQFFDEARFESYRTLGFHSVLSLTKNGEAVPDVESLIDVARESLKATDHAAAPA